MRPLVIVAVGVGLWWLLKPRKDEPDFTYARSTARPYPTRQQPGSSFRSGQQRGNSSQQAQGAQPTVDGAATSKWKTAFIANQTGIALCLMLLLTLILAIQSKNWRIVMSTFLSLLLATIWTVAGLLRPVPTLVSHPILDMSLDADDLGNPPVAVPDMRLCGTWVKDTAASDSMEEACSVMRLNGLIRTAIKLVRGVELRIDEHTFHMAVFSVIAWFKVREAYALSGEAASFKRRDLRAGKHRGGISVQPDGSVILAVTWDEPLGGSGSDYFRLLSDDTLGVLSTINVGGRTVKYNTIYRRKNSGNAATTSSQS